MKDKAAQLLREKKVLTKDDIPPDTCPTTPPVCREGCQLCVHCCPDISRVGPREMVVIDEDPAVIF